MTPVVHGPTVDDQTRCVHYQTDLDVIAIRFACGAVDLIAEGKIRAETLPISFDEIPASLEKLQHGGVRGRFVAMFA